jgi:hypothetical protein
MLGNVSEWTSTSAGQHDWTIAMDVGWDSMVAPVDFRNQDDPSYPLDDLGFRCAADPLPADGGAPTCVAFPDDAGFDGAAAIANAAVGAGDARAAGPVDGGLADRTGPARDGGD